MGIIDRQNIAGKITGAVEIFDTFGLLKKEYANNERIEALLDNMLNETKELIAYLTRTLNRYLE